MIKKAHKSPASLSNIFSDSDQLRLQQLLTCKHIAERLEGDSKGKRAGEDTKLPLGASTAIPEKWCLIPKEVKLYQWQSKCLEKWLAQGKGTVKVATGGGKTIFALAVAQALQNRSEPDLRLAIVVPTIALMRQWRDELRKTNIPLSAIGMLGGEREIEPNSDLRIIVSVINSARNFLPEIVAKLNWGPKLLLVVDECHRANAMESKKIFDTNPRYALGLSATPETDQDDNGIPTDKVYAASGIGRSLGPIIFDFSLKESLNAGLLTPFEVWHVGLPFVGREEEKYFQLSRKISELHKDLQVAHRRSGTKIKFIEWCQARSTRYGDSNAKNFIHMTGERKRLIYSAKNRNDLTINILSLAMKEKNRRAIVFHESIDGVTEIFLNAIKKKIPAVLEHSKLPKSLRKENIKAFRKGVARTIISVKSLVEGFNVPSADVGIIAASSGSVRQRIQSLGRMLRKKETDETAIVVVLYIKNTVDEEIYKNADWESVIGSKRNRYFEWIPGAKRKPSGGNLHDLLQEMQEIGEPPRRYRPPCGEIDTELLQIGSVYPAQATGESMKVDQTENLRFEDGSLAKVSPKIVDKILQLNKYRRAKRTPCGHLIVRVDSERSRDEEWVYLGNIDAPQLGGIFSVIKLRVKSAAGKKVIIRRVGRDEIYARGVDKASSSESGKTHESLLCWIKIKEKENHQTIHEICWDGVSSYWIELGGEQIFFSENAAPLEFPS